jgi:acyl-CoA oxidase
MKKNIYYSYTTWKGAKEYIGNAAVHGYGFAKLIIGETDYGVNAFLVPLRDTNSKFYKELLLVIVDLKWDLTALIMAQLVSKCDYSKENMLDRFLRWMKKGNLKNTKW